MKHQITLYWPQSYRDVSMLISKQEPCDTDLFILISTSGSEIRDHDQVKRILRESLKNAASNKDFDFEVSTLRLYKKHIGVSFLLLHTQVYGGAKSADDKIKYLLEAEKIARGSLKTVLDENSIKSEVALKQYIFYSQNLDDFKDTISEKFPNLRSTRIDDDSIMYVEECIIMGTTKNRQDTNTFGHMAFEIAEELVKQPTIDQTTAIELMNNVATRIEVNDPIYRARVKKVYKKRIVASVVIDLVIIATFLSFVYSYYYVFLSTLAISFLVLLILISILGMSVIYLRQLWNNPGVVYK